jgi:hypothetical protein
MKTSRVVAPHQLEGLFTDMLATPGCQLLLIGITTVNLREGHLQRSGREYNYQNQGEPTSVAYAIPNFRASCLPT